MQGHIPLADAQLFVPKMAGDSPYTHHIHLISHYLASVSSGMLSTVCMEQFFDHATTYLKHLMR
jgi:hypothetical protein